MSKADLSQADIHFYQMILVTPGMKRGFPMISQSTSACSLSSDRSELTLPHQLGVGMCRPLQPAAPTCLSGDPPSLLSFLWVLHLNVPWVPAVLGNTYSICLITITKDTTQLAMPGDKVWKSLCNVRQKRISWVLSLGHFQMIIIKLVSKLLGKSRSISATPSLTC